MRDIESNKRKLKVALITSSKPALVKDLFQSDHLKLLIGNDREVTHMASPVKKFKTWLKRLLKRESLAEYAFRNGISYMRFPDQDQDVLADRIQQESIDLLVCYGARKIQPVVLSSTKLDSLNCHAAPLPKYAGGNPYLWQVIDGVTELGLSIHRMTEKIDLGELVYQKSYSPPDSFKRQAMSRLASVQAVTGIRQLIEIYEKGERPEVVAELNHYEGKYAKNVMREEITQIIDWDNAAPEQIIRFVSYLGKWPVELALDHRMTMLLPMQAVEAQRRITSDIRHIKWLKYRLLHINASGAVELKPNFNPLAIYRHHKEMRLLKTGRLSKRYI